MKTSFVSLKNTCFVTIAGYQQGMYQTRKRERDEGITLLNNVLFFLTSKIIHEYGLVFISSEITNRYQIKKRINSKRKLQVILHLYSPRQ